MIESKTLQIISNLQLFKGLTEVDLKAIHAKCQRIKFKDADILLKEGQVNSAIYIIIGGQAEVCLPKQSGGAEHRRPTKVKLAIEHEGEFFGEYSLIDSKPASASVIATQAGELIKITKSCLNSILENDDRIAKTVYRNILKILVERLRNVNKEYDDIYAL